MIVTNSTPQLRSFLGSEESFTVCATVDGQSVVAHAETAKAAFAKAIEWKVAQQFADVAISGQQELLDRRVFSEDGSCRNYRYRAQFR